MILASKSPRRRQLLEELGFTLEVVDASIDETRLAGEDACSLVSRLARLKAEAGLAAAVKSGLVARDPDGLLVAADTIVWDDDGDVLGKPADEADATRMLARLSGAVHRVSTGVCAVALSPDGHEAARSHFVETTVVEFWPLADEQIAAYVATGEPMDKAGAYGIQGAGRLLVHGIRGDYFNVVGLPVSRLAREIEALKKGLRES